MSTTKTSGLGRFADAALDGVALSGASLITYGAHLVYDPAGFIVGGVFLLAGAWFFAKQAA